MTAIVLERRTPIAVERRTYELGDKLFEGDVADLFRSDAHVPAVLKIARDSQDNDLLENEGRILQHLYPPTAKDEKFYRYLPRLIDAGRLSDGRHVSVLPLMDGYISVADVRAACPMGIDFRDMAWMYKRLLSGLGFVHEMGVVHGAVLPPHVLVHPTAHGAKIMGWSYALNFAALLAKTPDPTSPPKKGTKVASAPKPKVDVWHRLRQNLFANDDPVAPDLPGAPPLDPNRMYVKAISVAHREFYAPEILRKETPSPATDIYMAAKVAIALLGGDVETNQLPDSVILDDSCAADPRQLDPTHVRTKLQAFLQVSLLPSQRKRPQEAWQVHEDFEELLLQLVGKPFYRPLSMPVRGTPS